MNRGFRHVADGAEPPDYVLFTDADIAYEAPDAVERLVRGAQARGTVLTSLMVKLRCESFAERLLVPAFVFFFAKLYPVRAGSTIRAARSPRRPAAACWCGARRWQRPAGSTRSAAR